MLTEWMGLGFYFLKGNASWRLLLGLQLVPGVAMLVASYWMPFSPRWLCMKGRYEEALVVLKHMHGGMHDDTFYMREYYQIKSQIELDKAERLGVGAIVRKKSHRKRLTLIVLFSFFCQ